MWQSDISYKIKRNFSRQRFCPYYYMDAPHRRCLSVLRKSLMPIARDCYELYWNKSWKQNLTKQLLYGHRLPIFKTIQIRWTKHVGNSRRSKNELISNVPIWTPSHGRASVGRPARTHLHHISTNSGNSLEDMHEAMDDRDKWQERDRGSSQPMLVARYIYIYTRIVK